MLLVVESDILCDGDSLRVELTVTEPESLLSCVIVVVPV